MAAINPVNVLLLLLEQYKPKYPEDTAVNLEELEAKKRLEEALDVLVEASAIKAKGRGRPKKQPAPAPEKDAIIVKFQPVERDIESSEEEPEDSVRADEDYFPTYEDEVAELKEVDQEEAEEKEIEVEMEYRIAPKVFQRKKMGPHSHSVVSLDYKLQAVAFWKSEEGEMNINTVKAAFDKVLDRATLLRWEADIQKGGGFLDKIAILDKETLESTKAVSQRGETLNDVMIKKFATEANDEVKLERFKASNEWVARFRKKHKLTAGVRPGTRDARLKTIEERLLAKCRGETKEGRIFTDAEIKEFALDINSEVREPSFKMTHGWMTWFRRRYGFKNRLEVNREKRKAAESIDID